MTETADTRGPVDLEADFRRRARRQRAWGTGLLIAAGVCCAYAGWFLFGSYQVEDDAKELDRTVRCDSLATQDRSLLYGSDVDNVRGTNARRAAALCAEARDWPHPVTALFLGLPLAAVGGSLRTAGSVQLRLRDHERALAAAGS